MVYESDCEETESIELFEPFLVCEPQSEDIFEEFSEKYVPTPKFSPHAEYFLSSVVGKKSLHCLYLAILEGLWDQDPYVVSYDTSMGISSYLMVASEGQADDEKSDVTFEATQEFYFCFSLFLF